MQHGSLTAFQQLVETGFLASVGVIWFMVAYQLVLAVAGYRLYLRAQGEQRAADDEWRVDEGQTAGDHLAAAGPLASLLQSQPPLWPSVSILIPAHNEEKVIRRTVEAMLRLEYPADRLQIVVINDGSTDATAAILAELAVGDPRVQPFHVPAGQGGRGKSRALNLGIAAATGEVLAVYDADNQPEPGALRYLVSELLRHPELGAALGKFRTINQRRNLLTAFISIETLGFQWMLQAGRWQLMRVATLPGTNFVVRREVLDRVGGWDEEALTEDSELSLRIYAAGWLIKFVPYSVTWEQEPESWPVWVRQRTRWVRGNNYVIAKFLRRLPEFRNRWVAFELLYSLALYYIFLLAICTSHLVFVLGLTRLVTVSTPGPYTTVWALGYLLFVAELGLALSYDREDTPRNWLLSALLYFTYCQGWLVVVARAFHQDVVQRRPRTWDKTVRVEATAVPDAPRR